jgi:hypothetical protein
MGKQKTKIGKAVGEIADYGQHIIHGMKASGWN